MKKHFLLLGLVIFMMAGFISCSDDDDSGNPEEYVEFTFDGTTYKGTGILSIEAYTNYGITTVACQKGGYYFWIEIPATTTGTYTKNNENAAMTVEASEGNYDAYYEDGMQTNFSINVTRFDDYIQGTFTGNVEGGASGDIVKSVSGSFFVKIRND